MSINSKEKQHPSIETALRTTDMMKLAHKDVKTVFINMFHMRKQRENMNMMRKEMEGTRKQFFSPVFGKECYDYHVFEVCWNICWRMSLWCLLPASSIDQGEDQRRAAPELLTCAGLQPGWMSRINPEMKGNWVFFQKRHCQQWSWPLPLRPAQDK